MLLQRLHFSCDALVVDYFSTGVRPLIPHWAAARSCRLPFLHCVMLSRTLRCQPRETARALAMSTLLHRHPPGRSERRGRAGRARDSCSPHHISPCLATCQSHRRPVTGTTARQRLHVSTLRPTMALHEPTSVEPPRSLGHTFWPKGSKHLRPSSPRFADSIEISRPYLLQRAGVQHCTVAKHGPGARQNMAGVGMTGVGQGHTASIGRPILAVVRPRASCPLPTWARAPRARSHRHFLEITCLGCCHHYRTGWEMSDNKGNRVCGREMCG